MTPTHFSCCFMSESGLVRRNLHMRDMLNHRQGGAGGSWGSCLSGSQMLAAESALPLSLALCIPG
jgi:hypothetical protein